MKNTILFFLFTLFSHLIWSQPNSKVDPNHLQQGGYGYLVNQSPITTVWWAEGAYKVMKDAPVPSRQESKVHIWSAKNEFESFIVVLHPHQRLEHFRIQFTDLKDTNGNRLDKKHIGIKKVEYVKVTKPTDEYGFAGLWPDPLAPYQSPETLLPGENQPFWITLKVPASCIAGEYSGNMILNAGDWELVVPLTLTVWDFTLPSTPTIRSGFGINMQNVIEYENLTTSEEEQEVFELYMESFRDYKISPYNPFAYSAIKESINGIEWQGGYYDSATKYSGRYAFKVVDNSTTDNLEASTIHLIPVHYQEDYLLSWFSRSLKDNQSFVAGIECYNNEKKLLVFENRFEVFTASDQWKSYKLELGKLNPEVRYFKIRLFPSNRTLSGENQGTVWFDDLQLTNLATNQNIFKPGNFEVNPDKITITLDFNEFNQAGKQYFDEFGFNGYRLSLKGLGGGTYYSRRNGNFAGFEQGTSEYTKLMSSYLGQMQNNLERNGWLGKEYIYWFDEPGEKDYPFVKETNALIKKYAPKITTFLTEHVAGQDISDVTDISCTIWHKLDHDKIKKMNELGLEHWSYLCCWPKSPWISEFIDHDAINLRMWLWASYYHQLKGILIWQTTYWNSLSASPKGHLQNPWEQAMSFVTGYGWPLGKQTIWGNGDGRFFYPLNRDPNKDQNTYIGKPIPSLRLEILRDGIEDYEYFVALENLLKQLPESKPGSNKEATQLLAFPDRIYTNETTYTKDPQDILGYRKQIAEHIVMLSSQR